MSARDRAVMTIDGHPLTVRPIEPPDATRLARLFDRCSPTTVYRRFFAPIPRPPRTALLWFATVDHDRREALVALDGDEIVAVARYDSRSDTHEAEVAVMVEDAWQRHGVGTELLRRLAANARDHGFDRFLATMLPDNRPAVRLLRSLSPDAAVRFEDGGYAATVPLRRAG